MPPNFQMLELVPLHCLIYLGALCPIVFTLVINVMLSHVKEAKEKDLLLLTLIAFIFLFIFLSLLLIHET